MTDAAGRRWQDAGTGKALHVVGVLCNVIAVGALVIAIVGLLQLPGSRRDSARDSCRLLRGLVTAATTNAPQQRAATTAYIARTPLRDCNDYAHKIVR